MPVLPYLPALLANALGGAQLTVDVTLTKVTPGTRSGADPLAGTAPTSTAYACKGFVAEYEARQVDGSIIRAGDRQVIIMGATLAGVAPAPSDHVTVDGERYVVVRVERDPAAATYTCQARGV